VPNFVSIAQETSRNDCAWNRLRIRQESVVIPGEFQGDLTEHSPEPKRQAFNKQVFFDGPERAKAATSNQSLAATVRVGILERLSRGAAIRVPWSEVYFQARC
jgi:hypothetical protein